MQSSHPDFPQAGYSQQYGYASNMSNVGANSAHDMSKQVAAAQSGMFSSSGGIPSGPQHHHQPGMAGPAPSPQPASLVQTGQQMNRAHMSLPNYYSRNNAPRAVPNMARTAMQTVVNQTPQQPSSQYNHTMPMLPSHPLTMAPILVNSPIAPMYQQRPPYTPAQYSLISPNHQHLYYNWNSYNNAPPPSANGYYPPHQMSYNTMTSQMPQIPATQTQQQVKKRLPIIDPDTGKNILEGVNNETVSQRENDHDPDICVQFATQVAILAQDEKNEPPSKSSSVEVSRIAQPVVQCSGDLENVGNVNEPDNNVADIGEQFIDNQTMSGTSETLPFYKKETDLSSINETYENKCIPDVETFPVMEVQDTKVYEALPKEAVRCETKEESKTDKILPAGESPIEKTISHFSVQDVVEPNVQLVSETVLNKAAHETVPVVSQSNLTIDESKTAAVNNEAVEPPLNSKQQEKPASESKKNKAKKKKDLNKRGESKEGGDMDAFLDRSEDVSSVQSAIPAVTPAQTPPSVSPPTERQVPSPIPTIVDSEILSTIPLPGETLTPLLNDVPQSESQNHTESVPPVSPTVETEDKENVAEESSQPKIVLKYSYKEDQWSPLNPEGKKQYDRDFLLQLQSQPMSLCKPSNLPNLDVIKDKAHIQRLSEVNRAAPMPVPVRAYDPFVPNYARNNTRPPHPALNRRSQQGRGADKKPAKIIVLPSNQNIKLHESENAWKPSHKVDNLDDNIQIMDLSRKVRGILNKLTPQKFETLVEQVKGLDINTEEKLNIVIDLVFEKAIDEPNFSVPYANMCKQLALIKVPLVGQPGQFVNFRKLLLTKCQKEFEQDRCDELKREERMKAIEAADAEKKKELKLEVEEEEKKMRYRQLGNIRFIGELFKLNMLIEPIMHECMKKLITQGDEESLECLCRLLKTIGKELDEKGNKQREGNNPMDQYFGQMQKIVDRRLTSSRVRFMLQDVIDLKKNNWVPRRDENNPKTIDQIHKEAEREAREQQQVYQNMSYPKRMPDERKRSTGRNIGMSEDGWTPSSKSNKGSYSMVDPSKLKLTKPDEVDSIRLGPGGRGLQSWGRGSSGGTKAPVDSDVKTALTNRYSALAEQSLTPNFENRRGSQRSAASSRESSRGRNSQLPPAIRKTPSTSRERENLIETVKEFNRSATADSKTQEVKRNNENQLNGKTVEATAVLALKGPEYSEDEIDKKTKPLIDEFLHNADFEEAVKCITELASPSTVNFFIYSAINQVLERSSQARFLLGQLLCSLVKKDLITLDQYKKGLSGVLENMDDYALDIPLIWDYMGEIIEPMIEDNKLPLAFLKDVLEPCIPSQTAGKLVSAVLHCAAKKKGTIKLGEIWRESGLQWSDFLGSSTNITDFIRTHKLDFTVSPTKVSPNTELTTEEIKTKLKELLDSTEENEKIFDWIDARVPTSALNESSFIRALATAVHEKAITGVGSKCELDQNALKKRIPLLTRYIDHNENLELQALYAIQQLMNELNQPKGLLRQIFDILYDDDVITEDTFKQWEQSNDPNELEGKGVALLSVRGFFTWLREAESGEDLDDE